MPRSTIIACRQPGKLAVVATKPLATQRDLSLAYSPGVAAACELIVGRPGRGRQLTARGNLVGVVTNGTAVLGLGAIGPLAAKPVMEGKAVLFKKFAGIDAFDIEIDERDPDKLVDIVAALEPTFGAINLEDIKAPECFEVEAQAARADAHPGLPRRPARHRDHRRGRDPERRCTWSASLIERSRLVASGAGAAALACLDLLVALGPEAREHPRHRHRGRGLRGPHHAHGPVQGALRPARPRRARWPRRSRARTSSSACRRPTCSPRDGRRRMAERPLILALANPTPGDRCPRWHARPGRTRSSPPAAATIRTRSTTSSCFPFIFRGALDVGATTINEAMKIACVEAIAGLARTTVPETVAEAYGVERPGLRPATT